MATCTNCGCNNINCGCKDSFLTSPAPCPTPIDCPDVQPCSEVFDSQCIVYTGTDILCDQTVIVAQNATVATALSSIVNYFCTANLSLVIPNDIYCQENPQVNTLVVPADTVVNDAIELVVDYFCERISNIPETVVEGGTGITVTDATVGNVTTYTVTATGPRLYYKQATLASSGNINVTHNLNTLDVIISVVSDGGFLPYTALMPTDDYTYTVLGLNDIQVNAGPSWAGGNVRITVLG